MTDKEVKQESLLPSVDSIYMKITSHSPLKELSGIPKEWILSKIKEAMESTRKVTLEEVLKENEGYILEKQYIDSLNNSPKLKVH